MRKLRNEELVRLDTNSFHQIEKNPVVIILDNIRSMNNVGSVFRTADAFLADKIFLCGITAKPPHRDIHKTALGATETVEWRYFEETTEAVKYLTNHNYKVIPVEQADQSLSLDRFYPEKNTKYAFILGNEVYGIDDHIIEKSDICIEIPQYGTKHSLNISVSTGVILWDFINKIKAT